jgi:hypothetical protein
MKQKKLQVIHFINKKDQKKIKILIDLLVNSIKKRIGKQKYGKKRTNLWNVIAGILYYARSGCSWRQLPVIFGNYKTVHGWFSRICDWKIFKCNWHSIMLELMKKNKININRILIDGSLTNFSGGGLYAQKNPRNRNKKTINRIFAVNSSGLPISFILAHGKAHDSQFLPTMIDKIRDQFDFPKKFYVHTDKGFDSFNNRWKVLLNGGFPEIPFRNMGYRIPYKQEKDRHRWKIERSIAWINRYKALSNISIKLVDRIEQVIYLVFIAIMTSYLSCKNFNMAIGSI